MLSKRGWLTALIIIIIGLIGIHFARPYKFVDFSVYYYAGHSLLSGRTDLYASNFAVSPALDYRYPPLFVILISPFSLLPESFAAYVWYWVMVLSIGGCIYLVWKMIDFAQSKSDGRETAKTNRTTWILAFFAVTQYFLAFMAYGNIHIVVTLLIFGAFYLLMRRRDQSAALLMALAVTIKIIPLLILPYFAVKKRWKFLTLTIVLTILMNLAPAIYFGFNRNVELLQDWFQHVVVNHDSHEKNSWMDLSLKGELRRYLTEIDYSKRTVGMDNYDPNYRQINVVSISEETSNQIWIAISLIVFALCQLLVWRVNRRDENNSKTDDKNTLVEYSLIICLVLFVGPLTPKIYFIKLLLPVAFLTSVVFSDMHPRQKFNRFILILVAVANTILPLLPGAFVQRLLLVIGTDFFVLCLLMIVAVNLLLAQLREKVSPESAGAFV